MPILSSLPAHLLYILVLLATAMALPPVVWNPDAEEFIFIIGGIAIWRYSWGLINWIRFHIYHHITFPKWRKSAESLGVAGLPSHIYLLVTSFRIGTETTRRVYDSVVQEAIHYYNKNQLPVTIVASIVERADQFLIKH
jgi:glycosyltransferase Alg8